MSSLATTLAVNLPFALTGAGSIRANWSYFFTYTDQRPPRGTIWHPLLGHAADLVAVPLFAAGLALIVILAAGARNRSGGALIPASSCRAAVGVRDGEGLQPPVLALDIRRIGDRRGRRWRWRSGLRCWTC